MLNSSNDLVEPAIAAIAPYEPGKPIEELERELGHAWGQGGAIKLASNENPYGPSPLGIAAAKAALLQSQLYPDGASFALRGRLASEHGVSREEVMVSSGSNELIDLIVQTFCSGDDEVVAPQYSFVAYRLAALKNRRPFRETATPPSLAYDVEALLAGVTPKTKVVFFANPNNPTGAMLSTAELDRLVERLPPRVLLVLDEAYFEYVRAADHPDGRRSLRRRERIISLRTFSKIYGLAGLRIGYALAAPPLLDYINRIRLPFNVAGPAQAAALAALDDRAHVERARQGNDAELPKLAAALAALGLAVLPSQTNFLLVDFGSRDGRSVYDALLRQGVIVRPMHPYGLPHHLRITVGRPEENVRLVAALRATLSAAA